MLTARQIRCIARGEWDSYFYWKVTHRYFHLAWMSVAVLILIVVSTTVSVQIKLTQPTSFEATVTAGSVIVTYEHGDPIIRQNDVKLPVLEDEDTSTITASTISSALAVINVFLYFGVFILVFVCYQRYIDRKSDYVADVEQKYIDSDFKQIPDKQSVIDFVDGGK